MLMAEIFKETTPLDAKNLSRLVRYYIEQSHEYRELVENPNKDFANPVDRQEMVDHLDNVEDMLMMHVNNWSKQ